MHNNFPPDERKPFLVPRTPAKPCPPRESFQRLLRLVDNPALPLAFIFLGVMFLAGYFCMNGNWEQAKDFLCIFLPPITALLGAVCSSFFRS